MRQIHDPFFGLDRDEAAAVAMAATLVCIAKIFSVGCTGRGLDESPWRPPIIPMSACPKECKGERDTKRLRYNPEKYSFRQYVATHRLEMALLRRSTTPRTGTAALAFVLWDIVDDLCERAVWIFGKESSMSFETKESPRATST